MDFSPHMNSPSRILLVEDEALVLMLLEDMLDELGHKIAATATDLAEAMELARTATYDLAIIDINLKGERTFPVAEIVQSRKLPLIFSTGYADEAIEQRFATVPVLQKPFDDRGLAGALARLSA